MRAVVHPSFFRGESGHSAHYAPPPSKSHFQRLCAAALLSRGITEIQNPGRSADDLAALRIIRDLGAQVEHTAGCVRIESDGVVKPRTGVIHCGESGLSARLFAPIVALSSTRVEIHGEGTLLTRPMDAVVDALQLLGAAVQSNDGRLPLVVEGPVQPRSLAIDGSVSSQVVSGLLFALSASGVAPLTLRAVGLVSRPYLEMSCKVLRMFGRDVQFDKEEETCTIGPSRKFTELRVDTEGDWSSIAAMAVGAALGGAGIWIDDSRSKTQADAVILDILARAGADVYEAEGTAQVRIAPAPLRAFSADCTHCPDLVPSLAILATACKGQSCITGLHRLAYKESDRAKTISVLLSQLCVEHSIQGDALTILGPQTPRGGVWVDSHNDHRIVMAAAIVALRADAPVAIDGAEAVRKSYPDFFEDLKRLGVLVDVVG